jgi:hypothetical protein
MEPLPYIYIGRTAYSKTVDFIIAPGVLGKSAEAVSARQPAPDRDVRKAGVHSRQRGGKTSQPGGADRNFPVDSAVGHN